MILRRLIALTLLASAGLVACGGDAEPATSIDRETFVRTYVMLRMTALSSPTGEISAADRDRILAGEGITADELEEFARVRGQDAEAMSAIWDEIEQRLKVAAGELPPDSVRDGSDASGGV